MKIKRIVNKALLKQYRKFSCVIGMDCFGDVVGHHLTSKGAGGDDAPENLIPLCFNHHRLIHDEPLSELLKFSQFRNALEKRDRFDIISKVRF